jgi:hypothetical protein
MSSFLSFRLLKWHSSTKCNHSSRIYLSMNTILSIFTFSWWCEVHLWQVPRVPWIFVFAFPASNNWKELVRLSKNITLQCNEDRPFKRHPQRHNCQASDSTPSKSYSMFTFQDIQKLSLQNFCIEQKTPLPNPNWKLSFWKLLDTWHNQTKVYVINTNNDCTNYLNLSFEPWLSNLTIPIPIQADFYIFPVFFLLRASPPMLTMQACIVNLGWGSFVGSSKYAYNITLFVKAFRKMIDFFISWA